MFGNVFTSVSSDDESSDADTSDSDCSIGFVSFDDYVIDLENNLVSYYFSWRDIVTFKSVLYLNKSMNLGLQLERSSTINDLLFHIGLLLVLWTWMGFGSPAIKIRAGSLNDEQKLYLEDLYAGILGEYFLSTETTLDKVLVEYEGEARNEGLSSSTSPDGIRDDDDDGICSSSSVAFPTDAPINVLVPFGGGKDSVVVYEMVRRAAALCESSGDAPPIAYRWVYVGGEKGEFDRMWRFREIVRVSGAQPLHSEDDGIDVVDFDFFADACEADENGVRIGEFDVYARGEVSCPPWAALVAYTCLLVAHCRGYNYIAMGNERSANHGNGVVLHGKEVNHQHDKSFPFERRTHHYMRKYLCPPEAPVYYFSGLMHWWEVQIMEEFASHPKYLPLFLSCNEAQLDCTSRWCAECSKCAFVYILLSAWLHPHRVWSVFGNDLFQVEALKPTFKELMGVSGRKPMECVGTPQEVELSLHLAVDQYRRADIPLPPLFQDAHVQAAVHSGAKLTHMMEDYNKENLLPTWWWRGKRM